MQKLGLHYRTKNDKEENMKKLLALLLSLSLVIFAVTACGSNDDTDSENETTKGIKTGLAVITSAAKSTDAGEKEGLVQADSTVVAVTVGADGKIVDCVIDGAQTKINFDSAGAITTDLSKNYVSKLELGDEYGMKKASSIGKEWNEQAQALAEYVKGKTVEEVKGIAVNEKGVATEADLTSSVTISISGYILAIEKAVSNAKDLGASAEDKIGLGITTKISKSTNATAEAAGLAQAYSTYTAVTFDNDGKITSCIIDGSQTNVNFDTTGKLTTDVATATFQTKNELGDAYGMKKASSIGKEWYEQAAAFAEYVKGKTVEEVKGISMDEESSATDEDLLASVTVSIGDFITVIEKANNIIK